jgi:biotin operon repressor
MTRQITKVAKVLRRNTATPGVSASQIARQTGLDRETVYKRISDLRNEEGHTIYSNTRLVKGRKTIFYRIAA